MAGWKRTFALSLSIGLPSSLSMAQVPGTDLWLIPLAGDGDKLELGTPERLTDRDGYDNQPSYSPEGESVFYTSIDPQGQADIWRYDLGNKSTIEVIQTAETSEYSPTPMNEGTALSTVRVEADGSQHLWGFPLDGGAPTSLLPTVAPVGYHAWIDERRVLLFVLGEPPTLQLAVVGEPQPVVVASNIGRSLARIPHSRGMSFIHKESEDRWWVTRYDTKTHEQTRLVATLPGREDVAWTPMGDLLSGDGSRLYRWRSGDDGWTEVADFADAGLGEISRIAVHPEGESLVVVSTREGSKSP